MQLLEHFKGLTLHPKNAEELKGLILQLAVQGKLTKKWREENPNVPSANKLLFEIEKEKEELISSKVYNAKYDTDFFEPLIARPEIPSTWKYVTIGKIAELLTGATPSRAKSAYFGGEIKWMVSGDIHQGYIYDCEGRITEEGMNASNCKILPIDSVMIALNGQGKTRATVALLKTEAACNQSLVAIKPYLNNSGLSEYIYYLLKGKYYQIRDITGQKQRRGLNMTLVSQLPIALPPLSEQKAIVEVVNQLFAEVEQLEALTKERIQLKADFVTSALNQLTQAAEQDTANRWAILQKQFGTFFTEKENIKKLREGILQLAVQGKLTHHWRALRQAQRTSMEPASTLLEKIKAEKEQLIKAGKIKKEKPLPEISEDEIPYELPEGWVWCRMQDVCPNISSGSTPPKPYFKDNGVPYLKVYNIRNQKIDFNYRRQFIDIKYHSTKLKRSILKPGDVIMNIVGPPLGKVAIIPDDFPEWNCNQAISFFQPLDRKLNNWIYTYLLAGSFLDKIELIGTAGQDNISVTKSKTIPLPLPPFEEQKAIIEKVNSLMTLCHKLEQEIETHQTVQEQWMQSCLRDVVEAKTPDELRLNSC